jgi:hypothetical protein
MVFDVTVEASIPAALWSVSAPIDAALRDGYATPATFAIAVGESARNAGTLVGDVGAYIGATAKAWLDGG